MQRLICNQLSVLVSRCQRMLSCWVDTHRRSRSCSPVKEPFVLPRRHMPVLLPPSKGQSKMSPLPQWWWWGQGSGIGASPKDTESGHHAPRRKKNLKSEIPLMKLGMENTQRQQQTVALCRILRPWQFCAWTQTELAEKSTVRGAVRAQSSGNACLGPRSAA